VQEGIVKAYSQTYRESTAIPSDTVSSRDPVYYVHHVVKGTPLLNRIKLDTETTPTFTSKEGVVEALVKFVKEKKSKALSEIKYLDKLLEEWDEKH
jgi:hypothetical protein